MLLLHNSLFGNPAYLCGFAVPMEGGMWPLRAQNTRFLCVYNKILSTAYIYMLDYVLCFFCGR